MNTHRAHPARRRQATWIIIGLLLPWLNAAGHLFGGERHETAPGTPERPAPFVLTVHEGRISLQAREASLQTIVEELRRWLHIEVVTRLPATERVTLTFERLSLEEVIQQLRQYAKITYTVKDAERKPPEITTMLVLPKRGDAGAAGPVTAASDEAGDGQVTAVESRRRQKNEGPHVRPAPFTFEFDPSQPLPNER